MWLLGPLFVILLKGICAEDGDEKFACTRNGQTLIGPSGIITTPGFKYSKPYPPRTSCAWKFDLPPNKYVAFDVQELDLEISNDCKSDGLSIYSRSPYSLLKKYCGSEIPKKLVFPTEIGIMLTFMSDDLFQRKGAKIYYETLDKFPDCGEDHMRCKNDECIPTNRKCNKVDDCGDGTDEEDCSNTVEAPKTCGRPKHIPIIGNGDRIIGGQEAVPHSWPWQISLQKRTSYPSGHLCGGALINNLWVVTAGHCLHGRNPSDLRIHLGMHNLFEKDDGEVIRYLNTTCIHPDFLRGVLKDDIALIKFNAPVKYTDAIQPVCLPPTTEHLEEGKYCHATGWGTTYGTGSSHALKQTMVPVIGHDKCKESAKLLPLSPNTICSGFENGRYSPCYGDSGGPFVCDYNQAWHLSGVVSWGPKLCGIKEEPSVYTKIADYRPWIERIIENNEKGVPIRCL